MIPIVQIPINSASSFGFTALRSIIKDGKLSLSMKALDDVAAEEIQEETIELPETEEVTTTLGSLFKNIKLN